MFCNECGTKLDLQPCKPCGAFNARSAEKCYKCGASFTLPGQPGSDALPAPASPDKEPAPSALSDAGIAGTLPTPSTLDLADAVPGWQSGAQKVVSATDANTTRSRRRWLAVIGVLLLALATDMVFVYFYYAEPEQLAQTKPEKTEIAEQAALKAPVEPTPDVPTPPDPVKPLDATVKSEDAAPLPVAGTQRPETVPPRAPPKAVTALAVRPLPATTAPVQRRQEPPVIKECPQAVATLGLCNAPTND